MKILMRWGIVVTLTVALITLSNTIMASEVTLHLPTETEKCHITMIGPIEDGDAGKLLDVVDLPCGTGEDDVKLLKISSLGGLSSEAEEITHIIQSYELDTMTNGHESQNFSAGFMILMAGTNVFIHENANLGHHAPWIPEEDYNGYYVELGMKGIGLSPYRHNYYGQEMITSAIAFDLQFMPPWLVAKYIGKIEGDVYRITLGDLLKLQKDGWIKIVRAK